MRIAERLTRVTDAPCFSFEFFPPKSEGGVAELFHTLAELSPLQPAFVSVTYGAGGATRERTVDLVTRIKAETGIEAMAHLACLGHSEAEIAALLDRLASAGVENLLALRGDPPQGGAAPPSDFRHASELVRLVRRLGHDFCVGAAAYPEGHIECPDRAADMAHLKAKVEQGVDFLVSQLFFDNAFYFDFVRRARERRIRLPVLPGLMPITNAAQIERFTRLCGATVPMRLVLELERRRADPEAVLELGVAHAVEQARDLLARGAPGIHFYTLNRSPATRRILEELRREYPAIAQDGPRASAAGAGKKRAG
ncbi:MAG: methylenetetrahydrofolate reductase [NAD(P)H] [Myxococcales bacterium]